MKIKKVYPEGVSVSREIECAKACREENIGLL
jgi:hypothetical protein